MIERIFSLVKKNAGNLPVGNPNVEKYRNEMIIEASSSIIDGIKSFLDNGKFNEILEFFRQCPPNCSLVKSISNKFASRLGRFYDIGMEEGRLIAAALIPTALADLVQNASNSEDESFNVVSLLSYINGRFVDFNDVATRLSA
ncbi:MAG TPA: hypothetical protein VGD92_11855 [Sphingobacteriaceae bacterium]